MLYNLIQKQFPEFVRTDYPTFVSFIQTYYKWLEIQFADKLENIVDIDATTDIVRVEKLFDGTPIFLGNYVEEIIVGKTSGARAIVKRGTAGADNVTLYIKYITADAMFVAGEEIYVEQNVDTPEDNTILAQVVGTNATGKVSSDYVSLFKSYLDVNGVFAKADPYATTYIKNIKDIYTAKGSEQALAYLLESVHNTDVTILYPSENILRASDGQWTQESFITIQVFYGTLPPDAVEMFIKYETSFKRVPLIRTEALGFGTIRLYYNSTEIVNVTADQIIQFRNTENLVVCQGRILLSPSTIEIVFPGKSWQTGQVVTIPGTFKDTIARVTQVDEIGSLLSLEIVDYGYNHAENQTLIISPYGTVPFGLDTNLVAELISTNPPAYKYTLTVADATAGISELISFASAGYFEASYTVISATQPYNFNTFFTQQYIYVPDTPDQGEDSFDWLGSRAIISFNYGPSTKIAGRWSDNSRGQISNQQIVLQDDYYYQQFSYVIDSVINPDNYIDMAAALHPTGMMMFTKTNLQTLVSYDPSGFTTIPYVIQDFLDVVRPLGEINYFEVTQGLDETVTITDPISKRVRPATYTESLTSTDTISKTTRLGYNETLTTSGEILNVRFTTKPTDIATANDTPAATLVRDTILDSVTPQDKTTIVPPQNDSVAPGDSTPTFTIRPVVPDSVSATDKPTFTIRPVVPDSVSATDKPTGTKNGSPVILT